MMRRHVLRLRGYYFLNERTEFFSPQHRFHFDKVGVLIYRNHFTRLVDCKLMKRYGPNKRA